MHIKSIEEADLKGKRVLARFDFNVPLSKNEPRKITDSSRIDQALPTIRLLQEKGASKIILMSHLGRPKGAKESKYSLLPVAEYLAEQLKTDVILTESAVDNGVTSLLKLPETKIVLLENLRFHPEEEKNETLFAEALAKFGDVYVNDAFGAAHRKHASVHMINTFFKNKNYAGLLLNKEIQCLQKMLEKYEKPFVAVLGGAKVSDKIKTLEKLLTIVDRILIGGAMAYPFLKAKGVTIGKSLCSDEDVKLAEQLLKNDKGGKIILPVDHIASTSMEGKGEVINNQSVPENLIGLDIGPQTLLLYEKQISNAKTIFWNGPMGLFENEEFAKGTMTMAKIIAQSHSFSVVGGGDSVAAALKSGFADDFSHLSTGGGASLDYIEQGDLPGLKALRMGV